MVASTIKDLYSTIYCQAHSQQHGIIIAGNNSGKILVFDVSRLLLSEESTGGRSERPSGPVASADAAHSSPIYSLASSQDFAIAGSNGALTFWKWSELADISSSTSASMTIPIECDQSNFGTPEINSVSYCKHRDTVWAACGDWKTRAYNAATGKLVATLEGHKDYVHQVIAREEQCILTCGEDGQVLVWDVRTPRQPTSIIIPSEHQELARPNLGKFISSVDYCSGEWIVCGGGPKAGVFHLRSGGLITSLPPTESNDVVRVATFVKENDTSTIITAGGDNGAVSVCNLSGQITAKIPSSARCVYSVGVSFDTHALMSIAGLGSKIDLCRNLSYRDHTVSTIWSK